MNLENCKKIVTEKKACYACLKTGHGSRNCKAVVKCAFCQRRHSSMLCPEVEKNQSVPESTSKLTPNQTTPSMSNMQCSGDVILQTVFVNLENNGVRRRVRLVFDSGCHRSYLLKSTAAKLGLKTAGTVNMCHILFGCSREIRQHQKYQVSIESLDGSVKTSLILLDQEKICGLLPRANKQNVIEDLKQKRIFVNDVGEGSPEIEVLIGADNFASLLTGRRKSLRCGLIALETAYGWTLTGELRKYESNSASLMVFTSMMAESNVTNLWDLELIGIRESALHKSQAERDTEAQQHFLKTVPDNFNAAKKRLDGTLRRLKSTNMVEQYNKIFRKWILEEIVEVVPAEEQNNRGHYLPHRPVVKPGSLTTPVRPVFDASCKSGHTPSLNDCLAKGPNLIELLPSVLNRFRCGNIGVSADIRKAFLMIETAAEDRDFLRFLWWEEGREEQLMVLRHKRVVFGVNCSPFLLAAVIRFHLSNVGPEEQEVAERLLKSMYVDNALTSVNTVEELRCFKNDACRLLADAKMELRQWVWTAGELTGEGILMTGTNDVNLSNKPDKREKGYTTPVFGMIQEAYAAVVYLRTQGDNNVSVQLLQAKSRVTPIRRVSIPLLELFGCVLAVRLTVSVKTSLELEGIPTIYWTDSTTALAWIRRNDQWGTLVGNRVREILSCTSVENWRHVSGNFNPADLPSRGCTAKRLKASSWWMGPDWLSDVPQSWPSVEEEPDEEIVASEKRRTAIASMINIPKEPMFGVRLGSFEKNVRAMAFILRIATWCKAQKKSKPRLCEELTTEELNKGELKLMWLVLQESFETVGASFHGLEVLLGEDKLVRVKTKLVHRNDSVGLRFPIQFPGGHPIVSYLIRSIHHRFCHAGVQFKQKRAEATPGALPKDRVKDAMVFETTGVDLCGPLYLKTGEKVWIVLFTCAVYRCVHLELITLLSAEAFLLALRRFIGRRENLLNSLDWRKIEQETAIQRIFWKFNPAAAPWWGEFWERLIRLIKDLLKRILGKARLTYTELTTCVIDVEAVINQRPLIYVAEDGEDLVPLTPAMFLREIPEVAVPDLDQLEKNGL
ncbi:uncharacterized protein LOC115240112 [Formica exsecta]|uniref:uncharacterized protein LOC115240112 n=1 Tax=Formica exsecta TaxID=72781 RepID=UPI0011416D9A|nr:uncharacterized protein LOC115240112 [Formica exsecta]